MDDLNLSGTEQRVLDFQSRLREDYAAKIQEVATLQTRLLDVEHENNVLRQQLLIMKNENDELKKGATSVTTNEEDRSSLLATELHVKSEDIKPSIKRERSPSLKIVDMPNLQSSSKKVKVNSGKGKEPADTVDSHNHTSSSSFAYPADIANIAPTSEQTEIEISENIFSLPKSVNDMYLQGAETLNVYPLQSIMNVTGAFLEDYYGIKLQSKATHVRIIDPLLPNSRRLFLSPLWINPFMPNHPGRPGLLIAPKYDLISQSPWSLFCKQSETEDVWSYFGEYANGLIGKVTAEVFNMQSETVKGEWARRLLEKRNLSRHRNMRARIALRLASVIPIDDNTEEARLIKLEAKRIEARRGSPVSKDDIITAFSKGEEEIDIMRMECVKYDRTYANELKMLCASHTALQIQKALRSDSMREGGSKTSSPTPSVTASMAAEASLENSSH